jgi:MFS family permease
MSGSSTRLPVLVLRATAVLAGLDAGSFGPTLPALRAGLHLDDPKTSWLLTAYVLGTLLGSPFNAWYALRAGYGRALGLSLGMYGAGAVLMALGPTWAFAFVARALQGLGGGSFLPLATVSIARLVPPERRGRAVVLLSLAYGVAFLIAAAGASFLAAVSWRAIYVLLAVLGCAFALVARRAVKLDLAVSPPSLDLTGLGLWSATLASFAVAIQSARGGAQYGRTALALSLVTGTALLALLVRVELGRAAPLLPVRLLRHAIVRATSLLAVAVGTGQVLAVMLPSYAVVVVGVAPAHAGVWCLSFLFAGLAGTATAAAVIDRLGARRVVVVTGLTMVLAALALAFVGPSRPLFLLASGALGMGVSTISGGPLRHLLIDLDADEAPPAQALLAMITNVGLLLGSALFGSLSSELGTRSERIAGMHDAVIGVTISIALALAVGLVALSRASPRRE